jgi:hypothetical protein
MPLARLPGRWGARQSDPRFDIRKPGDLPAELESLTGRGASVTGPAMALPALTLIP